MTVREAIRKIKGLEAERLSEISGKYMFFIEGGEPSKFVVEIFDGRLEVYEEARPSDCSISTDLETFEGLVGGVVNPFAAFMSGRLKISGDLTFAMKLNKLLGGG
ncbi:MAG: SCP2 sterol-binding domain-containing protein [Kosmotogaceae bacterium]|nr:SCP2 sterol-binding domain-containing protein [Kosmotogaceae bacterium]